LDCSWSSAETLNWNLQGKKASVTVKVRLFVVIGEVIQVERYTLKKVGGFCRIDGQEIEGDRVIGKSV
jgi:hypothetical protein